MLKLLAMELRGFHGIFFAFFLLFSSGKSLASDAPARAHLLDDARVALYLPAEIPFSPALKFFLLHGKAREEFVVRGLAHGRVMLESENLMRNAETWVREPLLVEIHRGDEVLYRTYFQLGDYLDSAFYYGGDDLGVRWRGGIPSFTLWAPTAGNVRLLIFSSAGSAAPEATVDMQRERGVWRAPGRSYWLGKYYLYEVTVFYPFTGRMETFRVTDPYSVALSGNSERSLILDVADLRLKPAGWNIFRRPLLDRLGDSVVYETHLRDFTVADPRVPAELKGKYAGFGLSGSLGERHLKAMAEAGLTHVHLLPFQDFATVKERESERTEPQISDRLPASSSIPQEEVSRVKALDSYNWGYDPVHYFAPEGSYATNPDDASRVRELREMIQRLHRLGLRVVMDVVFNHTYANGLDRVVPLYYYRLDEIGALQRSSCCPDTASERRMMEKLIVDNVRFWAEQYGIDGFRFDLMNLHTVANVEKVRDALKAIDPSIRLYGEGWSFGSLEKKFPGMAFTQMRAYGTGVATFNDRFRDAVRGGTTDGKEKSDQGWATGLYWDFNKEIANRDTPIELSAQRERLLFYTDVVKIGLAGNMRNFLFRDFKGNRVRAGAHFFRGSATGYTASPLESIQYVSAHDGHALWDAVQAKLPFYTPGRQPETANTLERVRTHLLALATAMFSQGIPFFEGGSEFLRSKNGDVDSYNSGDWFNRIPFLTNNWGRGLPPHEKNLADWTFWHPRLSNPALQVSREQVASAAERFLAYLRVRKSSALFRLPSLPDVEDRLSFLEDDRGTNLTPGLIALRLSDEVALRILDPVRKNLIVFLNPATEPVEFRFSSWKGRPFTLHEHLNQDRFPDLADAYFDRTAGEFHLPPRSVTVFEERR